MTQKTYIEKVKRLETLLKSQNIYDYMLKLMGVMVKNTLPKEEATRKQYDAERLKNIGQTHCYHLISYEKKELVDLIKNNHLVKHYALWKVGADYGTNAVTKNLDENLKKTDFPKAYECHIAQNKIKIPADKIRHLTYC